MSEGRAAVAAGTADLGRRIRQERERQKVGVREFAKRVGVSASLISQIETGKTRPSVSTLYGIVSELGVSLDRLFDPALMGNSTTRVEVEAEPATENESTSATKSPHDDHSHDGPDKSQAPQPSARERSPHLQQAVMPAADGEPGVLRADSRKVLTLETGVRWERLSPTPEPEVDFLMLAYDVGAESCPADSLMRHNGREFGIVVEGTLHVTVGFHDFELEPGDSICFDSTTPHRLWNPGDVPVRGIWFVLGRSGDRRMRPASE